jgi:hypothetical protein
VSLKAEMAAAEINDLPDSAFAYIEPGGKKDADNRTTPRSLRHFPIHDAAHVRSALSRVSQSPFGDKAMPKIKTAAKKFGIEMADDSDGGNKGSLAAMDLSKGAQILSCLYDLMSCESDEPAQLTMIQSAATQVRQWMDAEQREIGSADDEPDGVYPSDDTSLYGKSRLRTWDEFKAEPMSTSQLDRWLKGQIPRRMLAIPFGGPIPAANAPYGTDIDGEWFSDRTDIYGGHKALMATRERIVDFHHDMDPTHRMDKAIIGKAIFDEQPDEDGYWVDFWANAGEERLRLVRRLEERGSKLFGSSQSAPGWKKNKATGEITVWPWVRQTVSTSPQNTLAVVPPLKALLTTADHSRDVGLAALKAALVGLGSDVDSGSGRTLAGRRLTPSVSLGDGKDPGTKALLNAVRDARAVIRVAADVLPLPE